MILVLSGIATAIEVGRHDAETWETGREVVDTSTEPCGNVISDAPIMLTTPSGETLQGRTGADGIAVFAMPEGEAAGRVVARAAGLAQASSSYYPTRAACLDDREARFAKQLMLPACEAQGDGQRAVEAAWELVGIAVSADCAAALDAGTELRRNAPTLFTRIERAEAYARCAAPVDACQQEREAIAKRAMATDDLDQRRRIYESMPSCASSRT